MYFVLSLFYRFIVRDIRVNWVRTLLTICGIALGVSVYLAISIANGTALTKFSQTVNRISGKANIELMSLSGMGLKQDVLRDLSALTAIGVKYTPVIDEHLVIVGKVGNAREVRASGSRFGPGRGHEMIQLIGIDMLADPDFKSYQEDAGVVDKQEKKEANQGAASIGRKSGELSVFTPRAVLVGSKLAERYDLQRGDSFEVLIIDHREILRVAGVLSGEGLGGAYSGNLVVADIGLAQDIMQWTDRVSRIDLIWWPHRTRVRLRRTK